jgi:glycosyltransferase involved in cell wall biosynthesis
VRVSIAIPAYNEADSLGECLRRLREACDRRPETFEFLVVDDGSTDGTWQVILSEGAGDDRVRGLRLSRNFGHQQALSAGMAAATGDAVLTMDADLQHPPEIIPEMLDRAGEGYDVVYAIRSANDEESYFKTRSARAFYWLLNRVTSLDLPFSGGDFRYMSRRVVDLVNEMPERQRFLRGMTRWVGFEQTTLTYDRPRRSAGESKYTLRHMLGFALDALVSFSAVPLRIASYVGFVVAALGAVYLIYTIAAWALTDSAVSGWTSVIGAVLVLGGVQLLGLGILGQYVGRMYEEDKRRPLYVVWEDTAEPGEPAWSTVSGAGTSSSGSPRT